MGTNSDSAPHDIDVDYLELCQADVCGIGRSHVFTRKHVSDLLTKGYGLARVVPFLGVHGDIPPEGCVYGVTGEFILMPDMTTFKKLPWRKSTGIVYAYMHTPTGEIAKECPRHILREAMANLKNQFGYEIKIGFETEFMLLDMKKTVNGLPQALVEHNYSSQKDLIACSYILEDIVETLQNLDIDVIYFHSESAYGQFEIVTGPADPLKACDNILLTRYAISAIAHKHGFETSYIPKFYANAAGNGGHVHMSLWKDGQSICRGDQWNELSEECQFFIKGILDHQAAWMPWSCSTLNSFLRYQAGCWAGGYTVWGINNREATIRVLFPDKHDKKRDNFENKCFDQTCNPHLGVAALITAGYLGLKAKKPLPMETPDTPFTLSETELEQREAKPYPPTMTDAVKAFHADASFKEAFTQLTSKDCVDGVLASRISIEKHFASLSPTEEIRAIYNKF